MTEHRIPLAGPRVSTDTDDQLGYHPFYGEEGGEPYGRYEVWHIDTEGSETLERGYYWAAGFAGCLHDGEPSGPFTSSRAARDDADPSWREREGDTSQPTGESQSPYDWTQHPHDLAEELAAADALELAGVSSIDGESCERCDDAELADFFSVYVHYAPDKGRGFGVSCIADRPTYDEAKAYGEALAKAHGLPLHDLT